MLPVVGGEEEPPARTSTSNTVDVNRSVHGSRPSLPGRTVSLRNPLHVPRLFTLRPTSQHAMMIEMQEPPFPAPLAVQKRAVSSGLQELRTSKIRMNIHEIVSKVVDKTLEAQPEEVQEVGHRPCSSRHT